MTAGVFADCRRKERRQPGAVLVDIFCEAAVLFVHGREPPMDFITAWVEPALDALAMALRHIHRLRVAGRLAGLERLESVGVDTGLLGGQPLPVFFGVVGGALFRLFERV